MSLSTANSSFILDRRRLSIRLCAVFRAIFLPAALVADGCFFFVAASLDVEAAALAPAPEAVFVEEEPVPESEGAAAADSVCSSWFEGRGFIWMIFRERVGGGGSAKGSFEEAFWVEEEARRRDLTASAACIGKPDLAGGMGCVDFGDTLGSVGEVLDESWTRAGGGSSKASCRAARSWTPSLPAMSVEEAGVGGRVGRGMVKNRTGNMV